MKKDYLQDGNGFIDRRELGLMMRFMGESLTEKEIQVGLVISFFSFLL